MNRLAVFFTFTAQRWSCADGSYQRKHTARRCATL